MQARIAAGRIVQPKPGAVPPYSGRPAAWHPGTRERRKGTDLVRTEATLRLLWRPRAIVREAIPLLLVLILAWVDKQWVSSPQSLLRGWREPTHYGLVLVGALIA